MITAAILLAGFIAGIAATVAALLLMLAGASLTPGEIASVQDDLEMDRTAWRGL